MSELTAFVAYGDTSNPTNFTVVLDNGEVWHPTSFTASAVVTVTNAKPAAGPR